GQIAQKFDVSLFDLMVANGLSDQDFIQVGQVLEIPLGGLPDVTPTFTPAPVFTDTPLPFDPPTPLPDDATRPAEPAATVGPSATPSPTVPITPTEGIVLEPTPIPTSTPAPAGDISVTISNVVGAGNLAQETVIILNQGAGTSLQDWRLEGSSLGNFVFPDLFLFSGGSIRIHTAAGQNSPSDLYLGQGEAAWLPGGSVKLVNAAGNEVSRFDVPAQ
ncbi:MAG: LysM peptidoglycan-binding domain-containing protein, partial [Chloroflexi bacterium]